MYTHQIISTLMSQEFPPEEEHWQSKNLIERLLYIRPGTEDDDVMHIARLIIVVIGILGNYANNGDLRKIEEQTGIPLEFVESMCSQDEEKRDIAEELPIETFVSHNHHITFLSAMMISATRLIAKVDIDSVRPDQNPANALLLATRFPHLPTQVEIGREMIEALRQYATSVGNTLPRFAILEIIRWIAIQREQEIEEE